MIQTSCLSLIKKLFKEEKIDQDRKEKCIEFITREATHKKIRNLIAMVPMPKKLHKDDDSKSAYLRAAVSRVSAKKYSANFFF